MMSEILNRIMQYRYSKIFSFIVLIVSWFLLYQIYEWFNTESTDNAYLDAEISIVSAEVNGPIDEILVQENTIVNVGDIIAKIDKTEYNALYEKAASEVEAAKQNIFAIEGKIRLANLEKEKAIDGFEYSEASLKIAEGDFVRTTELKKENFASKQRLDGTEKIYEQAKNEYSQSKLNLEISNEKLLLLAIEKQTAVTNLSMLEQSLVIAKRALDNTLIKSPIKGMIGNSSLRKGNYVRVGVPLFSVVPIHEIYLKANFKETQIYNFKTGMKASFTVDSIPGYEFNGKIRNISPATGAKFSLLPPSNATGNFTKIVQRVPVLIDFDIPEELVGVLVTGMSCVVSVKID